MNVMFLFYLMIGVGVLILVASIISWDWFFKQRRAQTMIKLLGHSGARIFYAFLGVLFCCIGWMVISGRIALNSFL